MPCAVQRVYLVGIGRGVTVRGLWREERKRETQERKGGGRGCLFKRRGTDQLALAGEGGEGG